MKNYPSCSGAGVHTKVKKEEDKNWLTPRLKIGKPFHVNYIIKVLEGMGYKVQKRRKPEGEKEVMLFT